MCQIMNGTKLVKYFMKYLVDTYIYIITSAILYMVYLIALIDDTCNVNCDILESLPAPFSFHRVKCMPWPKGLQIYAKC